MNAIEFQNVEYCRAPSSQGPQGRTVLDRLSLTIAPGEFLALFAGGEASSTLLRLCNALLLPTAGVVRVCGRDTREPARRWELRKMAGMLFPDVDSQIIGATVTEDVAFGPENLGMAPQLIRRRVDEALQAVGLAEAGDRVTHRLSSSQKLRLALAGVLAMEPACLLLDNATATLDPAEKGDFHKLLRRVNREQGITVVQATDDQCEAASADRVVTFASGKIAFAGEPCRLFAGNFRPDAAGLNNPVPDRSQMGGGASLC